MNIVALSNTKCINKYSKQYITIYTICSVFFAFCLLNILGILVYYL